MRIPLTLKIGLLLLDNTRGLKGITAIGWPVKKHMHFKQTQVMFSKWMSVIWVCLDEGVHATFFSALHTSHCAYKALFSTRTLGRVAVCFAIAFHYVKQVNRHRLCSPSGWASSESVLMRGFMQLSPLHYTHPTVHIKPCLLHERVCVCVLLPMKTLGKWNWQTGSLFCNCISLREAGPLLYLKLRSQRVIFCCRWGSRQLAGFLYRCTGE